MGCFGFVTGDNIMTKREAFSSNGYSSFMTDASTTNTEYRLFVSYVDKLIEGDPYVSNGITGALIIVMPRALTTRDEIEEKKYYNEYTTSEDDEDISIGEERSSRQE
jgi:hypothetical protein